MTIPQSETLIPQEKQAVVDRALMAAFGVTEIENIQVLTGGLSTAMVYRIIVQGKPYLLRLTMRTDAAFDPTRQFACMETAAEAGIAPRIWYKSIEDRVLISDFVEAKPLPDHIALWMTPVLRTLHSLQGFPSGLYNYLEMMDGMVRQFQAANILPASQTQEVLKRYAEIWQVYPRGADELVASHNDLKPQNLIFDGKRMMVIDWEAAFLNDRYVDLAVVANFFVHDEAQEAAYLTDYFGGAVSDVQRARFYLMSVMLHLFYAVLLLVMASRAGLTIDPSRPVPDFRAFHHKLISGEIALIDGEERVDYALVHLREMQRKMQSPRFEESLAVVTRVYADQQA